MSALNTPGEAGSRPAPLGRLDRDRAGVRAGRGAPGPLFLCAETSENAVWAKFAELAFHTPVNKAGNEVCFTPSPLQPVAFTLTYP
jgi:hypothetical protein